MQHITTLNEYCSHINIPPPREQWFDLRRFDETMKTVNLHQTPFRHEFYAIALKLAGSNREVNGQHIAANLFFNTPYQVISWDIESDWQGWYIMFSDDFVRSNSAWNDFINDFPFLTLDKSIPFDLPQNETLFIGQVFEQIHTEYESNQPDRLAFIQAYSQLLLLQVRRCYELVANSWPLTRENRRADQQTVGQMQQLISKCLANEQVGELARSPSYYAEQLNMHPNHLNAIVKRISGKTASQLVQEGVISAAKALLNTTGLTVKEIAYQLYFSEPTHFVGFFKKHTGQTPHQFREGNRR